MSNRLSKIYTGKGDDGTSGLADGTRLPKDDLVFVAMGDIDELNCHIGMILAYMPAGITRCNELTVIQHLLFNLGGEMATQNPNNYRGIYDEHWRYLEKCMDKMNARLPPLKEFILPKGSVLVCQTHLARSIARRAERSATTLKRQNPNAISDDGLKFLNRLSDYLFVLGRYLTDERETSETFWHKDILADLNS
ncbi:MAG: cob(I)yrinic acid a,c-diamide adenosyltransferase [Moraxella sp.]|nr:cob(I)yrinic acid a,c-diamide adenosyltransferase [Moraxella sp.]